jgi:biopolymer transport protein ExbD
LVHDSWRTFQRSQRTIVADLSRGLQTLKAVANAAPFLGLAGTGYGILVALFFGTITGSRARAEAIMSARIASALITSAAGILVAILATLSSDFLRTRIDRFERASSSMVPAGLALHEDQASPRPFRLAQTLLLKKRFSALPPFALLAAAALASIVAVFMAFEPYETPTGLAVRLLPIGSLDGDRLSSRPVVIAIVAGANGSPVIRVNSRETPPNNLEDATRRELKLLAEPRVYVEAESTVAWADVTNVIDMMEGLNAEVVLLTATSDTSSRHTAIGRQFPVTLLWLAKIPITRIDQSVVTTFLAFCFAGHGWPLSAFGENEA